MKGAIGPGDRAPPSPAAVSSQLTAGSRPSQQHAPPPWVTSDLCPLTSDTTVAQSTARSSLGADCSRGSVVKRAR